MVQPAHPSRSRSLYPVPQSTARDKEGFNDIALRIEQAAYGLDLLDTQLTSAVESPEPEFALAPRIMVPGYRFVPVEIPVMDPILTIGRGLVWDSMCLHVISSAPAFPL